MSLLNMKQDALTIVFVGILALTIPINVTSQTPASSGVLVASLVTQEFLDAIKNQATGDCAGKSFYTRDAFLSALDSYSQFGTTGSADDSKREIAAFFAHVTHETGFLCHIEEELNKSDPYCDTDEKYKQYPCTPGKFYYGRGPLQISWNYNYGAAGEDIKFDGLNSPERVANDAVISFKTALWFWMTNNIPSALVNEGFGKTIQIINSGECQNDRAKVESRIEKYNKYCQQFGVSPGQKLSC